MLAVLWVMSHLLAAIAIYIRKYSAIYSIFAIVLTILVLLGKSNTYDLEWYLPYMEDPYPLEPIFYGTTLFLSKVVVLQPEPIMLFWQAIIFVSLVSLSSLLSPSGKLPSLVILITIGSVFFILSSQNGLRQGVAISLLLYFYALHTIKRRNIKLFLASAIPLSFIHYSTPIFIVILIICLLFKDRRKLVWGLGIVLSLTYGAALLYSINIYSESYASVEIDWGDERTPSITKFIIIAVVFFLSSLCFHFARDLYSRDLIKLRQLVFFSSIPLAFSGEFFARYMYFYYAVELLVMLVVVTRERGYFARSGVALLVIAYGFAPNAINIIVGGEL